MESNNSVEVTCAPSFFEVTVKQEHEDDDDEDEDDETIDEQEIDIQSDRLANLKQEIDDEEEVESEPFAAVDVLPYAEDVKEEIELCEELTSEDVQGPAEVNSASTSEMISVASNPEFERGNISVEATETEEDFKEEEEERLSDEELYDNPNMHLQLHWENTPQEGLRKSITSLCGASPGLIFNESRGDSRQSPVKKQSACGKKSFTCSMCSYTTFWKSNLSVHVRTHTKERPFACNECKARFSTKSQLQRHMLMHTGERPYKCDFCSNSFSEVGTLKAHKRVHTGEKPYVCDVCSSSFSQLGSLNTHKRIHTGDKPYVCDVCSSSFSELGTLKTHKRIHTGEKPYVCKVCSSSFSHLSSLKRHRRTHTGEKPFRCDVCGKSFSRKNSLTSHKKLH